MISGGYRVNSVQTTRFRQWATRTLREHLTQGKWKRRLSGSQPRKLSTRTSLRTERGSQRPGRNSSWPSCAVNKE
ncbi:MAG: virulence RhuM family protein [Desulfomicrobium sp.]|nr:virulence RhuM family protein [Desulfomicrobium sp.]